VGNRHRVVVPANLDHSSRTVPSFLSSGSRQFYQTRFAVLLVGLGLLGGGLFLVFKGELNADEGFYLQASRLVNDGLRPYADFGFTQTPLTPYANLPWLHLFGFDLLGVRLAGLMWTAATVALGATLVLRADWSARAAFVFLLAAAPGWLAFSVKGKTYAFGAFAVMLSVVALRGRWRLSLRWLLFLAAATIGVCARLPLAAFFAVAGIGLLIETPQWKWRCAALLATTVLAGSTIWLIAHGAWEQAWFWTVNFHRQVDYDRALSARLREFLATGPAIWVAATLVLFASCTRLRTKNCILEIALLVAVAANLGRRTTYGEYVVPLVPVAALLAAPWIAAQSRALRPLGQAILLVSVALSALVLPPKASSNALIDAATAAGILREHVAKDGYVLASMPEVPIASGHPTYVRLALGKFAMTEELSPEMAARLHMMTSDALLELLVDQRTQALVLSDLWTWNFGWSLPSMHWRSKPARDRMNEAIRANYEIVYSSSNYVVLLRKPAPTMRATTALEP
jgi:hypothetical protein